MMNTPICDFVKAYADKNSLRLHMPGHKGTGFLGAEKLDITEIEGADILYNADGIIKESEENAASLFGSAKTLYSAEGSSLSVRAMLYLTVLYARSVGKRPFIAAGRNAHKSFITAAALMDIDVAWIFPEHRNSIISCEITPEALDGFLKKLEEKPVAVYLTSPDYLGNILDIKKMAEVCQKHGCLLLVDNAHGAYLRFLHISRHPISLGADICCDSAHKTLPVLTGGAYLHISNKAPKVLSLLAENSMSLFASTSPSYLILQSLDMANRYLSDGYKERLDEFISNVDELKNHLADKGFKLVGDEPLKITISPKEYGYNGYELSRILSENGITCEFCDPDFIVMMLTPEIGKCGLDRIEKALSSVIKRDAVTTTAPIFSPPARVLSLKDALFSPSKNIPLNMCCGKVLADITVSCPPAIPIAVCGERLNSDVIRCFEYYGISDCNVIDSNK